MDHIDHVRTRNHTITPIVEKGLTGRPAAKASALEALLLYVELDKPDPVIEELLPLLAAKQPKTIVATLSALTSIYHAYGCKTVEPKPVLKLLPKVYGHADKNVRAEAQNLTVEMYRWLREAMKPLFWNELKPVQQTDLEKLFEKVKDEPAPKQERLLRSQQAAVEARAEAGGDEEEEAGADEEEAEIDLEPEVIAVDVFPKIPKDLDERISSTKWKDRKDVLDEIFAACNFPAIEEGPFDNIIRACAKSMKDANIAVVTIAANCVEAIAKGLRNKFAKYRNIILSPMLERFKEKKQSVTDALAAACDALFLATGLGDLLEETLEFLKHKNPQVKLESTKFITRCLKTTKEAPQIPEVKLLADAAKALLSESQAGPRDAGAEVLGVLWKIMGDRNMLVHLEGLDDIRKNKIKEFCDNAEVKAKWKPKAAPPPAPAKAAGPAAKKPLGKRPAGATVKKAPAPARAPSPGFDEAPPALQPRPTSRPGAKPAAKTGLSSSVAGLKKPGLARPGSVASPKRAAVVSPVEETPSVPAPRGLAAPGRGLAGRPLTKPSTPEYAEPATPFQAATSSLSHAERSELSDFRAEVELLRQQNSDLRADKLRLQSTIHELQNQNAQLIEDHTRDVLSIKAKETQLVRARSDADEAEERLATLQRDADRMKREVTRLQRVEREGAAYSEPQSSYGGYSDRPNGLNGRTDSNGSSNARPAYSSQRSFALPHREAPSASSYGADTEGKENIPSGEHKLNSGLGEMLPPSKPTSPPNDDSEGRASPALVPRPTSGLGAGFGNSGISSASSRQSSMNRSQNENMESWKRAAEVTQNLKARIELMKVSVASSDVYLI